MPDTPLSALARPRPPALAAASQPPPFRAAIARKLMQGCTALAKHNMPPAGPESASPRRPSRTSLRAPARPRPLTLAAASQPPPFRAAIARKLMQGCTALAKHNMPPVRPESASPRRPSRTSLSARARPRPPTPATASQPPQLRAALACRFMQGRTALAKQNMPPVGSEAASPRRPSQRSSLSAPVRLRLRPQPRAASITAAPPHSNSLIPPPLRSRAAGHRGAVQHLWSRSSGRRLNDRVS
ncbi:hypothetical protein Caci_4241 [Catenulispora acidiphila DSM 44928]|uniref:Uncharacterized protein n=1 Tax=Catenulispora acidiphila (strain DSM 44928 / JCM 14897 / NBRC 102108 / NRRL B-24433 / ID139908) TaxID=479433 RepID=C7QI60_CATAD|nr:hypothetical protein Caci_4241 [Catenulispora acidiphila DSM 44928]